ncbi:unnamed protein product [Pedinophyceae sp. YPF-701]|nr:unnamed protein product [Pedinophyceae sp. YPF-701]
MGTCGSKAAAAEPGAASVKSQTAAAASKAEAAVEQALKVPEIEGSLPADTKVVFVLGGPGAGKGTQCEKIVEKYGFKHLSAGDLLREEGASGSDVGQKLQVTMKEGKLVPMEVTITLLKNAMIKSGQKLFLIDGFPRALDQAAAFESDIVKCEAVLFFDLDEATMEERLINRGKTSGRADDNVETIRKRFHTFVTQSKPVVDKYKEEGKVFEISSKPPPDEVFEEVVKALDSLPGLGAAPAEEEKLVVPAVPGDLPEGTKVVFVLGGPGAGKGTQCEKIVEKYGFKHLSAGDLLREEVASGSDVGQKLQVTMKEGKLVPMEVTITLLKNAMIKSGQKLFLIDGFPRALAQAAAFESDIVKCEAVLFFDLDEATMEERLINRGKTSGRADDNVETIRKRFHTFVTQSKPVVDKYKEEGKVFEISSKPPPDEVFEEVVKALDSLEGLVAE